MEIRVYDRAFRLTGVIDAEDGIRATETASGMGTVSVKLPAEIAPKQSDYIVVGGVPYVIRSIETEGKTSIVSGLETMKILLDTVIGTPMRYYGTPARIISQIVALHDRTPISVVGVGGESVIWATGCNTLYEEVIDVADAFGLILRTRMNGDGFILDVGTVADKRDLCLSDNMGTAVLLKTKHDFSKYANRAIVYSAPTTGNINTMVYVDASGCNFDDGIDDFSLGIREVLVHKYANKIEQIYNVADGYTTISRTEVMRREGIAALRKHRPTIEYEMAATDMTPPLAIGDRVTVRTSDEMRAATLVKRTIEPDRITLTLRA